MKLIKFKGLSAMLINDRSFKLNKKKLPCFSVNLKRHIVPPVVSVLGFQGEKSFKLMMLSSEFIFNFRQFQSLFLFFKPFKTFKTYFLCKKNSNWTVFNGATQSYNNSIYNNDFLHILTMGNSIEIFYFYAFLLVEEKYIF